MTHERWQQIERVLQAALASKPANRAALLERECAGDPELRAEVESLLVSEQAAESFFGSNALEDATALLDGFGRASFVGRSISHYVIEKQIGAGGMGKVYLARDTRLGRKICDFTKSLAVTGIKVWPNRVQNRVISVFHRNGFGNIVWPKVQIGNKSWPLVTLRVPRLVSRGQTHSIAGTNLQSEI